MDALPIPSQIRSRFGLQQTIGRRCSLPLLWRSSATVTSTGSTWAGSLSSRSGSRLGGLSLGRRGVVSLMRLLREYCLSFAISVRMMRICKSHGPPFVQLRRFEAFKVGESWVKRTLLVQRFLLDHRYPCMIPRPMGKTEMVAITCLQECVATR